MSLTSLELNYLIWRYLQESGYELAAYALQKHSHCLEYEHDKNRAIAAIEPGTLVNLVQKGILHTFVEDACEGKADRLSLVDAILQDKQNQAQLTPTLPQNEPEPDVEMKDEPAEDDTAAVDFATARLAPYATFPSAVAASWHPSSDVVAVGRENATAEICALGDGGVAETVTLSHPPVLGDDADVANAITTVSWAPQGSMVLTSGLGGAIRAWTPDGRLKNIVNSVLDADRAPATLHLLIWNRSLLLALTIDVRSTLRVWDGTTLLLVLETRGPEHAPGDICACWVSDSKFAVSTAKHAIRICSVSPGVDEPLATVGQLVGHANAITSIAFSAVSKLLASASDVDYAIKIWNSLLSLEALEVNCVADGDADMHYHTTPVVGLHWLTRPGDVQGNELLSVSMDGAVNIWDAFTGDAMVSANIFKNADNYRFSEDAEAVAEASNSLVFATALSPQSAYLAVGDDAGNVSIWDVHAARYRGTKHLLRCLGTFSVDKSDVGVCDLAWDSTGRYVSVCYKGRDSVVLKWDV